MPNTPSLLQPSEEGLLASAPLTLEALARIVRSELAQAPFLPASVSAFVKDADDLALVEAVAANRRFKQDKSSYRATLQHLAVANGQPRLLQALLAAGASPCEGMGNKRLFNAAIAAAKEGDRQRLMVFKQLLDLRDGFEVVESLPAAPQSDDVRKLLLSANNKGPNVVHWKEALLLGEEKKVLSEVEAVLLSLPVCARPQTLASAEEPLGQIARGLFFSMLRGVKEQGPQNWTPDRVARSMASIDNYGYGLYNLATKHGCSAETMRGYLGRVEQELKSPVALIDLTRLEKKLASLKIDYTPPAIEVPPLALLPGEARATPAANWSRSAVAKAPLGGFTCLLARTPVDKSLPTESLRLLAPTKKELSALGESLLLVAREFPSMTLVQAREAARQTCTGKLEALKALCAIRAGVPKEGRRKKAERPKKGNEGGMSP